MTQYKKNKTLLYTAQKMNEEFNKANGRYPTTDELGALLYLANQELLKKGIDIELPYYWDAETGDKGEMILCQS